MQPTHLDLFSGIGGFSLAFESVGFRTIGFSEIDPYASAVLRKHWPDVTNYGDVRTVPTIPCDVITGGFPCQPFSVAGKRRGATDDRFLWPSMLDVIARCKPAWVLGENVPGIIGLELDRVLADLEGIGLRAQSLVVPACAVGAKQLRDRVWVVGCNTERQCIQGGATKRKEGSAQPGKKQLPGSMFANVWDAVSTARVWRADHGVSSRLDVARNKCVGNSIVPQVAQVFAKAIYQQMTNFPLTSEKTAEWTSHRDTGTVGGD